jgi:hypothetical protein
MVWCVQYQSNNGTNMMQIRNWNFCKGKKSQLKKQIGAKIHKILISKKKKTYSIKNSPLYLENGCKFVFHDFRAILTACWKPTPLMTQLWMKPFHFHVTPAS